MREKCAGDVSAATYLQQLQVAAGELAAATPGVFTHQATRFAAAPGLLAHASVTEIVKLCPTGPKLRYTAVSAHMRCA
jgi:hypothetical protein